MKKSLLVFALLVTFLLAVMLFRALTVFEERQVEPLPVDIATGLDESAAVSRLSAAIRIPTVSYDDRSHFDTQAFLAFHEFLTESYPRFHQAAQRTVINDYSLVYHLPGRDSSLAPILLMGHYDVVPVDPVDATRWSQGPFSGALAGGSIWGRGSMDDKLGVIALMEAMENLVAGGFRPQRSIWLAFGHDEEVGGLDGAKRIAEWFRENGIRFDFVLDEGGAVTEGTFQGIDEPVAVIGVAEKGWVNLELTVNAAGGHSSQPPAHTAVGILSRAIVALENDPFPATLEFTRLTIDQVAFAMPLDLRFLFANSWLLEPLMLSIMTNDPTMAAGLRTTTAATMVSGSQKSNVLPTQAKAVVNFRIQPGETAQTVLERARKIIDDDEVEIATGTHWDPSPVSPTDSDAYRLIAGTIRGIDPAILVAPYVVRGGTDGRYFYGLSDQVYRFLMIRVDEKTIEQVHGVNEHVAVSGFAEAIRFYRSLIQRTTG